MPAVLRIGPYRFFFYSNEGHEPAHIHVRSGDGEAKFWLNPIAEAWTRGYHARQLRQIEEHIQDNLDVLLVAWHEYFREGDDDASE